jgi:predicted O-methyltransferase YrrM
MPSPVITFEPPYTPEMLPEAQAAIEALLTPGASVFEYGSGHSTLWLAGLGADVVSVEHDPEWYIAILNELENTGLDAGIYLVDETDLPHTIAQFGQFDMVIVDCLDRRRIDAIIAARPHVKQGGHMVIDDSQWRMLQDAPALLRGWEPVTFSGDLTRKTGAVRFHETTIYKRPVYV